MDHQDSLVVYQDTVCLQMIHFSFVGRDAACLLFIIRKKGMFTQKCNIIVREHIEAVYISTRWMLLTYIALVWTIKHYNERHSGTANLVKCILIKAEKASIAFITAAGTYFTVNTEQISLSTIRLSIGGAVHCLSKHAIPSTLFMSCKSPWQGGGGESAQSTLAKAVLFQLSPQIFHVHLIARIISEPVQHFHSFVFLKGSTNGSLSQLSIHFYLNRTNIASKGWKIFQYKPYLPSRLWTAVILFRCTCCVVL